MNVVLFLLLEALAYSMGGDQATKGLAAEYGVKQIRVNSLLPLLSGTGLFETFVGVPFTPENVKNFLGNVPLGRLTDPTDVAKAALFLGKPFDTTLSFLVFYLPIDHVRMCDVVPDR